MAATAEEPRDTTALAAMKHALSDISTVLIATHCWLSDPTSNTDTPEAADIGLQHIAKTVERARTLLASEAADLAKIRDLGGTP